MIQAEMHDILTVLAVGVFADKKVFSSEIQVFTKSVSRVELSKHDMPMISGAQALMWFEMNKDNIREKFDGPRADFDAWIIPILRRIGKHVDKKALLRNLGMISVADQELHVSEKALIVLVKKIWDLN